MPNSYQEFLSRVDPLQAEVVSYLDQLFLSMPGVNRKIRFRVPFYDYNSWFCYLNPIKTEEIELCFLKGVPMSENFPMLDLKNRKMVSGLTIAVDKDIPQELIVDMLNHAISLNK